MNRRYPVRQKRSTFGGSVKRGAGATLGCVVTVIGVLIACAILVAIL